MTKKEYMKAYYLATKDLPAKRITSRAYYWKNKEKILAKHKENRIPQQWSKKNLARRESKLEIIAGRPRSSTCEICGSGHRIKFDHDHKTGAFRGWICHDCNFALGHARDDKALLLKFIQYLEKNNVESKRQTYTAIPLSEVIKAFNAKN